jgi:hypothetical protein
MAIVRARRALESISKSLTITTIASGFALLPVIWRLLGLAALAVLRGCLAAGSHRQGMFWIRIVGTTRFRLVRHLVG